MRKKPLDQAAKAIGHGFTDPSLLDAALTHSSAEESAEKNYERLEFLGDALINLVIADYFFSQYPDYAEGQLTQLKAHVVNRTALARLGRRVNLDDFVSIGKGLAKQGVPDSVMCDVVEAVCAAVFIDAGVRTAREFVLNLLRDELADAVAQQKDAKSRLQETVQHESNVMPVYEIVDVSGKEHEKIFFSTVTIAGIGFGPCEGKSKKEAEQNAALLALRAFTR
ncbi:MAG: ribonuclease III [Planctomycetota bacterium]